MTRGGTVLRPCHTAKNKELCEWEGEQGHSSHKRQPRHCFPGPFPAFLSPSHGKERLLTKVASQLPKRLASSLCLSVQPPIFIHGTFSSWVCASFHMGSFPHLQHRSNRNGGRRETREDEREAVDPKAKVTLGNATGGKKNLQCCIGTLPDGDGQEGSDHSEKAEDLNNCS